MDKIHVFEPETNPASGIVGDICEKTLHELYTGGALDIRFPILYRGLGSDWKMTIIRKGGRVLASRYMGGGDTKEAVARIRDLMRPVFVPGNYLNCFFECCDNLSEEEREDNRRLKSYYPELQEWPDNAIQAAWNIFSIVVHGTNRCDTEFTFSAPPRDELFLDYLWHVKIMGNDANLPFAPRYGAGKVFADEVAIWRKWHPHLTVGTPPAGDSLLNRENGSLLAATLS